MRWYTKQQLFRPQVGNFRNAFYLPLTISAHTKQKTTVDQISGPCLAVLIFYLQHVFNRKEQYNKKYALRLLWLEFSCLLLQVCKILGQILHGLQSNFMAHDLEPQKLVIINSKIKFSSICSHHWYKFILQHIGLPAQREVPGLPVFQPPLYHCTCNYKLMFVDRPQ